MATQTNRLEVLKQLVAGRTLVGKIKWYMNTPLPGYENNETLQPVQEWSVSFHTLRALYVAGLLVETDVEDKSTRKEFKLNPDKEVEARKMIGKITLEKI
jgi:hypothetical protein